MRCNKCGQDWPSEFYFSSPEQCIYCDKKEGLTRRAPASQPPSAPAKWAGFPDLIQLFFVLVLAFEVLALVGLLIGDLQSIFGNPPGINLTIGLPINAVYDSGGPEGRGLVIDEAGLKAVIREHYATFITFKTLPDPATVFLLFFHAYKDRLISLVVIVLLMLFYHDVQRGKPFFRKNLNRLNIVAVIIIFIGPVDGALGWWISNLIVGHLHVPSAILQPRYEIGLGTVLWGMIILAVVQIIRRGIALQEEHDLTI